ncbi:MAG: hypothetical protein LBH70_10750 [Spirochaetaceae bacterium]|nr:hypothetical protein [Spirochaetaceae bacterium]
MLFVVILSIFGGDFGVSWRGLWLWGAVMVLVFLGMNGVYIRNYRLVTLLEREDWPALALYLEDRVIKQGRYASLLVGLLANTYLVLSDYHAVMQLERKTAGVKPRLVDAYALIFGTARILEKEYEEAAYFFEGKIGKAKPGTADWLRWYSGFAQLLNGRGNPAADRFIIIAQEGGNPVLAGLSAYFLAEILPGIVPARSAEFTAAAMAGRKRVCAALPVQDVWNKKVDKIRCEVYAAVLSHYLDETSKWLYTKENLP